MGTYEELKAAIQQVITTNGNNEITGALLQQTLLSIVNTVGNNATFAGIATPTTNPGTPDQNVFYLATEAGTYVNFGGIQIAEDEAVILSNKTGNWTKTISGFATQQQLTELSDDINKQVGKYQSIELSLDAWEVKNDFPTILKGSIISSFGNYVYFIQFCTEKEFDNSKIEQVSPSDLPYTLKEDIKSLRCQSNINETLVFEIKGEITEQIKRVEADVLELQDFLDITSTDKVAEKASFGIMYEDEIETSNTSYIVSNPIFVNGGDVITIPAMQEISNIVCVARFTKHNNLTDFINNYSESIILARGGDAKILIPSDGYVVFCLLARFGNFAYSVTKVSIINAVASTISNIENNNIVCLGWNGNRQQTRLQIPKGQRKFGMTIKYFDGFAFVEETYCYRSFKTTETNYDSLDIDRDVYWGSDHWWKVTNIFPIINRGLTKGKGILITGASLVDAQENGWFENACESMGVTALNKAVSGTNILDTAVKLKENTLFSSEDEFYVFVIFHVQEKDVYRIKDVTINGVTYTSESLIKMSAEGYESNGIIDFFADKVTGSSHDDNLYALAFDYVIKKYKSLNRPFSLALATYWNDGRPIYNRSIRELSQKWSIPLIVFDETLQKNLANTFEHPSLEFARPTGGTEGSNQDQGATFMTGWHMAYQPINGELPFAQKRMASIFCSFFS